MADIQREAERLKSLILRCEDAVCADRLLDREILVTVAPRAADAAEHHLPPYTRSIDAALTLLPEGADWRRLTDRSASTYAANPYNAAAQVRHDGYGATVALQICSAALKVRLAPIEQKLIAQNRKGKAA